MSPQFLNSAHAGRQRPVTLKCRRITCQRMEVKRLQSLTESEKNYEPGRCLQTLLTEGGFPTCASSIGSCVTVVIVFFLPRKRCNIASAGTVIDATRPVTDASSV